LYSCLSPLHVNALVDCPLQIKKEPGSFLATLSCKFAAWDIDKNGFKGTQLIKTVSITPQLKKGKLTYTYTTAMIQIFKSNTILTTHVGELGFSGRVNGHSPSYSDKNDDD
jgi:hypothetical protein